MKKNPSYCTGSMHPESQKLLVLNVMVKEGEESGLLGPLPVPFQEADEENRKRA